MKSFNAGELVFLNNPEHKMHQQSFTVLSKVYNKRLTGFEYCIECRGIKLFVDSESLYKIDEIQSAHVAKLLGEFNDYTH